MKHYIYITLEGSINWIEKMPEKPMPEKYGYDSSKDGQAWYFTNDATYYRRAAKKYDKYIERAKAESIPFEDQLLVEKYIYGQHGHDNGLPINYYQWKDEYRKLDSFYPIELDADIQKVEVPEDSGFPNIDGTNYPTFKKVARIVKLK